MGIIKQTLTKIYTFMAKAIGKIMALMGIAEAMAAANATPITNTINPKKYAPEYLPKKIGRTPMHKYRNGQNALPLDWFSKRKHKRTAQRKARRITRRAA